VAKYGQNREPGANFLQAKEKRIHATAVTEKAEDEHELALCTYIAAPHGDILVARCFPLAGLIHIPHVPSGSPAEFPEQVL
jgi:hypothetical protein